MAKQFNIAPPQFSDWGDVLETLGMQPSGNTHLKLITLMECGFIARDYVWSGKTKSKKLTKFRLKDNYLRFYLRYIDDKNELIEKGLLQQEE